MSDALTFPASAKRAVWVFSTDLLEDTPAETLRDALGLSALDADHIELFDPAALSGYSLSSFLIEANGIDAASVAPDAARLDALTGQVLLVFSGALPSANTELAPKSPLCFIGRYIEQGEATLRAAPAMPKSAPPLPTPEPPAKHVGSALFIFAALVLAALFVLVFVFGALPI